MLRLTLLALISLNALAWVETPCGTRKGTAGNAFLEQDGEVVLTLATQGSNPANQRLANQADRFIRGGMQVGKKYCVNVALNRQAVPYKVLGAYQDTGNIRTVCGIRGGTAGNAWLESGDDLLTLAVQGSDQYGLEVVDAFIAGGTQVGTAYCANGIISSDGVLRFAVGAFKMP